MPNADIPVDAFIQPDSYAEFDSALEGMVRRLEAVTGDAAVAAGTYINRIARAKVLAKQHGSLTWSPAPPGTPPASVSGRLAASFQVVRTGPFSAMAGPTARWARIQELGGGMTGHMHFAKISGGRLRWYSYRHIELKARPYYRPSVLEAIGSGLIEKTFESYWATAMES